VKKGFKLVLVESGDAGALYSIQFEGERNTEFEKFLEKQQLKDSKEVAEIGSILNEMTIKHGFLKDYFKEKEGKKKDSLVALRRGRVRLYCLRWSDVLLIVGNGGVKKTPTYQDDQELNHSVEILQDIDELVLRRVRNREIRLNRDTGELEGFLEFSIGDI
jgi:hypothetical protein